MLRLNTNCIFAVIITARIRRKREGNISVCPHLWDGGGVGTGVPHSRFGWEGCLIPRSGWRRGVPHPRSGWGVTHPMSGWGIPGYPHHPSQVPGRQDGVPHIGTGWGIPHPRLDWIHPPSRTGWSTLPHPGLDGVPLPPCQETEEHSEHLLHSGRIILFYWRYDTYVML